MGKRETWVDCIKVLACALILVGHLLQGLQRTGILVRNESLTFFLWFIYLFHVQLFFLCSGYLYERGKRAGSFKEWICNIGYKLVALGIPYLVFSIITWFLKSSFVDLVNIRTGHLWSFLLTSPALAQYWYLYTLFFLFFFIPNVKNTKILVTIFVGFFVFYMFSARLSFCFVLYSMAQYGFWFVLGMLMQNLGFGELGPKKRWLLSSLILIILFTGFSSALYSNGYRATFSLLTLLLGVLACLGFSLLFRFIEAAGFVSSAVIMFSKYTFPIYLLHTIYAASVRTLLIYMGVRDVQIHVVLGLLAGICGSMLTAWIFEKTGILEFVFYPWKVIKKFAKR
jgi:fucose 4-O-acetylase-like acetyltransferase